MFQNVGCWERDGIELPDQANKSKCENSLCNYNFRMPDWFLTKHVTRNDLSPCCDLWTVYFILFFIDLINIVLYN